MTPLTFEAWLVGRCAASCCLDPAILCEVERVTFSLRNAKPPSNVLVRTLVAERIVEKG